LEYGAARAAGWLGKISGLRGAELAAWRRARPDVEIDDVDVAQVDRKNIDSNRKVAF